MKIKSILERNPIIPAIKDNITLEKALNSNSEIVFIILANIVNIKEYCDKLRDKNKIIYVHIDMIDGLNSTNSGIDYIMNTIKPDGILTTKSNVVAHAYKNSISVIQRFFILDTLSYEKALLNIKENKIVTFSLEFLEYEVGQRVIDFVSGAAYAMSAHLSKVTDKVLTSIPMEIDYEDIDASLGEDEGDGTYL